MSEARSIEGAVGRKRPRSSPQQANNLRSTRPRSHNSNAENVVSSTIRRSDPDAVKAFGSPVKPLGTQTPGGAHAAKAAAV
jgi:hypothetical protein